MIHDVATAPPERFEFELTANGYLRLSRADAQRCFPADTVLAMRQQDSLLLLATRGPAAGGLLLKQRNPLGDRSLLIADALGHEVPVGHFAAEWDESVGGYRVDLSVDLAGHE
ncbi:MAG: hydrogenase maturation protease [Planctomycetaceae bacterium]|nr:hydrogenase maturation protease [Planctomycetaceae bacterium]